MEDGNLAVLVDAKTEYTKQLVNILKPSIGVGGHCIPIDPVFLIELDRKKNRAKVKEINMVKRHVKTTKEKKGGIISKESFIHLSNLRLISEKNKNKKNEVKK